MNIEEGVEFLYRAIILAPKIEDCKEAISAALLDAHNIALEEAAKVCEGYSSNDELLHEAFKIVAEKIRALKTKEV